MNSEKMIELFSSETSNLRCLKSMGFVDEVLGAVPATAVLPEAYIIDFHNQKNRSITMKMFDVDGKGVVSIFIRNTENRETFSLISWIQANKIDSSLGWCHLIDYEGNFPERLNLFLRDLSAVLCKPQLMKVLLGEAWESIPFDWAGMR